MIDSGPFPAVLRRSRRYQFPGNEDPTYNTTLGIVTFGEFYTNYSYAVSLDSITIGPSVTQTITISAPGGTGADVGYFVGWPIYLWAGSEGSPNHILARITAYDATDPYNISLTFEAFQVSGSGTFDYWSIRPQFQNAHNYIQNPNYSGFDISARTYEYQTASFLWPWDTTTTNVVTSNTQVLRAGYTLVEYKGYVQVQEDEYEINRPYVGKTASVSRVLTTVVEHTVWNYATYPPEETTTTTTTTETVTKQHAFNDGDFDPSAPEYVAGFPAVYSNGELVQFPTPSGMIKNTAKLGEYKSYEYQLSYEETAPGSGVYRPLDSLVTTRTFGSASYAPIDPPDFFNGN